MLFLHCFENAILLATIYLFVGSTKLILRVIRRFSSLTKTWGPWTILRQTELHLLHPNSHLSFHIFVYFLSKQCITWTRVRTSLSSSNWISLFLFGHFVASKVISDTFLDGCSTKHFLLLYSLRSKKDTPDRHLPWAFCMARVWFSRLVVCFVGYSWIIMPSTWLVLSLY